MVDYGNPLWQKLVKTIADECEIEEVSAEGAADAILAIPEIRGALARKCDVCDETDKGPLRCNECAQILASDY